MNSTLEKFLEEFEIRYDETIALQEAKREIAIKQNRLDEAHSYYMAICGMKQIKLILSQVEKLI